MANGFIRLARALALTDGESGAADFIRSGYGPYAPELAVLEKAITGTGDIDNPGNAALQGVAVDFMGLVRRRAVFGLIRDALGGALRSMRANAPVLVQTSGATGAFVGEALVIPISDAGFKAERYPAHKAAGMLVVTEELARVLGDDADAKLNRDLGDAVAEVVNDKFCSFDAPTSVAPGGIFYGATEVTATGNLAGDAAALIGAFQGDLARSAFILNPQTAATLNALGLDQMGAAGGYLMGVAAVTTTSVPVDFLGLVDVSRVGLIDEGFGLEVARHASISVANAQGPTSLINLWANNLRALRALWFVNWVVLDPAAVLWTQDSGAVGAALKAVGA
ncbi:hypothetical protein OKW50_000095 [Paraburkholderia youngii]|uniref:phage major capsid protein n=1 Tax=Paraburkholderia youngii TaxID=2782701 RepID=UPI003D24DC66